MWRFQVDRGGTFTDVVAWAPDGRLHRLKLLSEDPNRREDAAVAAMRQLTGVSDGPLPACELRLGTTVATNALLERRGAPVLLAITRGFGDALEIGTQARPDIFALAIRRAAPHHAATIEIDERMAADGTVLRPLDEDAARAKLRAARVRGIAALAVVLVHGWKWPAHELALGRIAREEGFSQVSLSHMVTPTIRLVPRGQTTVADATTSPALRDYVERIEAAMGPQVAALYMQSGGALAEAARFHGRDAVLSGPAGGIVGMAAAARAAGLEAAVGFDMGGTSTDVSWWAGALERETGAEVAGLRLAVPMLAIHTVAAGGGSICGWDGTRLFVGPQSAGAVPGPACYRRGGPLTVTDCNLILGRLQAEEFPAVFGPGGDEGPDLAAAEARIDDVIAAVAAATGQRMARAALARGFLAIAATTMAQAIKAVSLARGHDVTRAGLVCFGGAGGQHACDVADALGMIRVLVHPLASLLSAWGMGLAERGLAREATLALPLDEAGHTALMGEIARLGDEAAAALGEHGAERRVSVLVREAGGENVIAVAPGPLAAMRKGFAAGWRARFGYAPGGALVAQAVRIEVAVPGEGGVLGVELPETSDGPVGEVAMDGGAVPMWRREGLAAGFACAGPALVVDAVSTIVVARGWRLEVDRLGNCVMTRAAPARAVDTGTDCDPVRLEVMAALFMAVAEDMGAALRRSASSVNIRERLDFSCAVFDRAGALVANAPHVPVHLGSMGECVRHVIGKRGGDGRGIRRGDVYASNSPAAGGTHLPDITVIMPVFAEGDDAAPAWWVAARGHHADVGGISPGSMPPGSRSLAEEGVVLDGVLLVDGGGGEPRLCEAEMRSLLGAGPWPARDPDRNIADLAAQVAACARGGAELRRLAAEQGRAAVDAYMGHVQAQSAEAVRALIGRLADGEFACAMDSGATIRVRVAMDRAAKEMTIDFTGTSGQRPDNFNAPAAVVRAAVLYVLRCLIDLPVPLNEGCMAPVRLVVPAGSMLAPGNGAAVVAGNVETSQVLCDALFGAFGAMAASQGTMNNLTFGDARRQYYETIAGGAGAGPGFAGASAVQTHMTNSRLTDPEVLETRFPVVVEEFAIRRGSGGRGRFAGGDGAVRRLRFCEAMDAGILANRRVTAPFGLAGGGDGAHGRNRVIRADGRVEELGPSAAVAMAAGDVLEILTPGGGGFGPAEGDSA